MKKKMGWLVILMVLISIIIAGCGGNNNDNNKDKNNVNKDNNNNENEEVEKDPVTVTMSTATAGEWLEEMKPKVEEKFKHITLELVDELAFVSDPEFDDVVVADKIPDIIPVREHRRDFMRAREYDLEYNLDDMIAEKDFDLSVYDEDIIQSLRNSTPSGGIVGLPFHSNYFSLHYNKDIFDKQGIEYPEDNMTWFEVIDLASEVVTDENYGLTYNPWLAWFIFTQFEENLIDPDTHDIDLANSTAMQQMFEMADAYASIPNNKPSDDVWGGDFEEGNVAMEVSWARTYEAENDTLAFEFDFATFPTWKENPGVGVEPNIAVWMITSVAEDKEAAFDVISYLTSPELRVPEIRKGSVPVLAGDDVKSQFMADFDQTDKYNFEALYSLRPSSGPPKISPFENDAPIREMMDKFVYEERDKDVNTFLRETQQVFENYIKDEEGKE